MTLAAFNRYKTAGDLIAEVGIEVGLPPVTDPYASSDPQYLRMCNLLNVAGNNLIDMYPWTRLIKTYTFPSQVNVGTYDLPLDFNCMIPQTMWQPNMNLAPGYGSVTPQVWTYLNAVPLVGTINIVFREKEDQLQMLPVPTSVFNVSFEYQSRSWVMVGQPPNATFRDNASQSSDTVLLYAPLISRYLKMKFLEAVGFDSTKATDDFNLVLDSRQSKTASAPILSMAGGGVGQRLINALNLPETNYGF